MNILTSNDSAKPYSALRSLALRLAGSCFFYSGALGLSRMKIQAAWQKHSEGRESGFPFLVLLYHRVTPSVDPFLPGQSVQAFEGHMRFLAKWFRVRTIAEIIECIRQTKEIEPWTVAVTFDDGYRDNYLYAYPILKRYGLRASIFVPTGYIETGRVLWNDRVGWAIKTTKKEQVAFSSGTEQKLFRLQSMKQKRVALAAVLQELKTRPDAQKISAVDELIKTLQDGKKGPEPAMVSWAELRELARGGWDIGSHTVNHVILTRVSEPEVQKELTLSKEALEKELQIPVPIFAYPNGKLADITPRIKTLVREAGYQGAVTTLKGPNTRSLDPFEIHRNSPWEEHIPSFAIKTVQAYRDSGIVPDAG